MPANLTPDYLAAEARFRSAESDEEKLAALDAMYATIPKHKGTEKLRADIKRRISRLKDKEKQAAKHGKRPDVFHVAREGAGQVVLLGQPNSGKSSVVAALTLAQAEVAPYPGSTRIPLPGMMEYEDVQVQLVDTPPLMVGMPDKAVIALARAADAVAVVLDASDNLLLDQFEGIRAEASSSRMALVGAGRAEVAPQGTLAKPALVVANKTDMPDAAENFEVLSECYTDEFPILAVSTVTGEGLEDARAALFEVLGVIRVYSKQPGRPADTSRPFILKRGSTLAEMAASVHRDFASRLRFARAWGRGLRDGAQIGRDHVLTDGTIVELHT